MSKPFDATLKGMLERNPADWLELAGYSGAEVEVIDADVSTFTAASDKVILVHGSPDWLLDINFQCGPDARLPEREHLYNTLLEYRHRMPTRSVVVLLTPDANLRAIDGQYLCQLPGEEPYRQFRYHVIRVWELPAERLLRGGLGTLPLAPLGAITEEDLPGVVAHMQSRLTSIPDATEAKELWTAIYILMGLRYEKELVNHLLRGVLAMQESVTYQAIIEEGMAKGMAQGIARGELRHAQKILLRQGEERFGRPSAAVKAAIEKTTNLKKLDQLSLRLLKVRSWSQLLK